jgi:hypothetical protein
MTGTGRSLHPEFRRPESRAAPFAWQLLRRPEPAPRRAPERRKNPGLGPFCSRTTAPCAAVCPSAGANDRGRVPACRSPAAAADGPPAALGSGRLAQRRHRQPATGPFDRPPDTITSKLAQISIGVSLGVFLLADDNRLTPAPALGRVTAMPWMVHPGRPRLDAGFDDRGTQAPCPPGRGRPVITAPDAFTSLHHGHAHPFARTTPALIRSR